ncbi:uncharacterized protein LOC127087846 [Lathyrus oleraceus]|uniref:uncharacterized protein LOC127087846 n=1 Tax=Pisum sativum TaxID=3888 RepID=UPI0021D30C5C|nr:uncharacterized protein LOC127087846 [Pisum sativum]
MSDIHIKYHITSSIWSSIKSEVDGVSNNIITILDDGCNTNFWLDHWCDPPLISRIQDPEDIDTNYLVSDFLHNGSWNLPTHIINKIPNLSLIAGRITIPIDSMLDSRIWIHSSSGNLTLKDAYSLKSNTSSTHH